MEKVAIYQLYTSLVMDVPWGTGDVYMVQRSSYPSIADYVSAQDWNNESLHLFYTAPRRSGVYLGQDFYCYTPECIVSTVTELPPQCHDYDCLRGVSFFCDKETVCTFASVDETISFNYDEIRVPKVLKNVTLYPGHNIIVWCDSDFPVSVDWTCYRDYTEQRGSHFCNYGWWRKWEYYLSCPTKVLSGVPLGPWSAVKIPEGFVSRCSGAYRVHRGGAVPQTGLSVLVWPSCHEHTPPSLGIMSRVYADPNIQHAEHSEDSLLPVLGDITIQQLKKRARVVIMCDPIPVVDDVEEDESIYYS